MIAFVLLVGACQQAPTLDAEAGFQGTVFPDAWTRISASIAYQGPPLDVDLRMTVQAFTSEAVVYRKPLRLMGNVRMRTAFDLYVTDYDYAIDVELVEKGKVLSKLSLPLTVIRQETRRLLAVGTPPKVLNDAMAKLPPVTLVRQRAEVFPSTALALRSVDAIFFAEPVELDPDQESALLDWIRRGGRLIFGAPRSTILRHQSFWKELCPLETPDVGTIPLPGTENQSLTLVRGRQRKGRAGSALAGVPLMLRSGEGDGEVVFIPFVLDQPNFAKVVAAAPLLAELLDLPPPPKEEWVPRRGFVRREEWILEERRTRVTESTRDFLRRLLPVEWSLSIGSLASGVGLILVYIVLIGPVEYRRLRQSGRLRSGWRSLAALTVLFGAAVYVWSRHVSPQTSKTTLVTLLDADQVRTFGAIRPGWGDVYQVQSSGLLSLLPPSRAFGAPESFDPMVVTLPSEGRLPIPPSDTRLLASARPPKPGEAGLSATWAGADRNTLLL
ncbi:MAG TPA: hypothetical protein VKW04_19690, partial [Planctomycetota bacterium]|nr:hypothetical protein [Planctomycetota bacterium]